MALMDGTEIWYHPNDNSYWALSAGGCKKLIAAGGYSATDMRNALIASGALDRTPGAPAQVVGLQAMQVIEACKLKFA